MVHSSVRGSQTPHKGSIILPLTVLEPCLQMAVVCPNINFLQPESLQRRTRSARPGKHLVSAGRSKEIPRLFLRKGVPGVEGQRLL